MWGTDQCGTGRDSWCLYCGWRQWTAVTAGWLHLSRPITVRGCVTAPLSARALRGERRHSQTCQRAFWWNGLLQSMASGAAAVSSVQGGGSSGGGGGAIRISLMYRWSVFLAGAMHQIDAPEASSYFTGGAAGIEDGGVEGNRGWCHGRGRLWGLGVGRVGNSQRWEEGVKFLVWCRSQWRGSGCFARRSPTACRFSEFIMNVLLFFPFSLTFLFSFALCHFPPSLHLERHFHKRPPPCHRTVSPSVLRAKNKELCEGPLVASPPGPAVAVS